MKSYWTDFISEEWVTPGTEVERLSKPIAVCKVEDVKILTSALLEMRDSFKPYTYAEIKKMASDALNKFNGG